MHFIELTHVDTQNTTHRAVSLCCCRGTHKSSCYYMKIALLVSKPWHEEPGSCHHQVTSPQPLVRRVICLLGSLQECMLKFKTLPKTQRSTKPKKNTKKNPLFLNLAFPECSHLYDLTIEQNYLQSKKTPKYYTCNHIY